MLIYADFYPPNLLILQGYCAEIFTMKTMTNSTFSTLALTPVLVVLTFFKGGSLVRKLGHYVVLPFATFIKEFPSKWPQNNTTGAVFNVKLYHSI